MFSVSILINAVLFSRMLFAHICLYHVQVTSSPHFRRLPFNGTCRHCTPPPRPPSTGDTPRIRTKKGVFTPSRKNSVIITSTRSAPVFAANALLGPRHTGLLVSEQHISRLAILEMGCLNETAPD